MNKLTEYFFQKPDAVFAHSEVTVAIEGSDDSRYGLVKRAMKQGEIYDIRRGLYCLAPRYQKKAVSIYALSQRIYGPSYVSLEMALSYHGLIPEAVYNCTCASYGNAREFQTPLGLFVYRRIPQRIFYAGVERCIDADENVFFMASPVKALADYVYIHRLEWRDIREVFENLRVDEERLAAVTPEQLETLAENYRSRRVTRFLTDWKRELEQCRNEYPDYPAASALV